MSVSDIFPESSPASLPQDGQLRRKPRWGWRQRPDSFAERFEDRILFYDAFFAAEPRRVLLVGPPPLNLGRHFRSARFWAKPSNTPLYARFFPSLSTMITALDDVPAGTDAIAVDFAGIAFEMPVQPSLVERFRGRRLLFTMSKDNPVEWIAAWAQYHARRHGTDAIVFFDNGSTYEPDHIARTLSEIEGIDDFVIFRWPYVYGAIDRAVIFNPYWTQFLQVSAMGLVLRRIAGAAEGMLNADIDELIETPTGESIYSIAARSAFGLVTMQGRWVEPAVAPHARPPYLHGDFPYRLKDAPARICKARKWVIDPRRNWFGNLEVHPYMHWIENRPHGSKHQSADVFFWHFKGINTNWKVERAAPVQPDESFMEFDSAMNARLAAHIDKDAILDAVLSRSRNS
ncbi:hypothetical protein [Pelagibacterium limicola]|uniref:hypothetical protein n=1 Tax=Pelagibacterium limicola TaxID=2791022 RepID=UPI0018AF5EA8|nr:hypothetical protein [Pelagibacterium limicola]